MVRRSVRRSSTASRDTVVLVFYLRMRRFSSTEILTTFLGKNIYVEWANYQLVTMAFVNASLLHYVYEPVV